VAVPSHLVERVRESLETEETEKPSQTTTLSPTQRALNLFVPVTTTTTQKATTTAEALDESSGQEPTMTTLSGNGKLMFITNNHRLFQIFCVQF
jgi:hypothetical protein